MGITLDGKVVAVTGAGRGIGRATAIAMAESGARVVVNDLGVTQHGDDPDATVAGEVVSEITQRGGEAVAVTESVTSMEGGKAIVHAGVEKWGRIDAVVCAAGILRERMLFNMSEEEWDGVIATHLKGTFTVFRAAAPIMREQGSGSLIGITSGAYVASVAQANYSAAKGGIVSLVRSAAAGLYKYGVTANAIAPTAHTRMSADVPTALAEIGEPEDVAPMIIYLASDAARHVTAQVYSVAGGKIALWSIPQETKAIFKEGRWTPDEIDERMNWLGQSQLGVISRLKAMAEAAKSGEKPNA